MDNPERQIRLALQATAFALEMANDGVLIETLIEAQQKLMLALDRVMAGKS